MPPMDREVQRGKKADPAETRRKRKEKALAKEKLVTEHVTMPVPEGQRVCPTCDRHDLRPVGDGKTTTIYEYVPAYFRRRVITRETLACACGEYIVTAPCPDKATDKTQYAPSFVAHLIVQKCADSIPFYRLEKQYDRIGVPIARSTMTDLFHRHAWLLAPLVKRLLARIASSFVVLADETKIRMLGSTDKAYLLDVPLWQRYRLRVQQRSEWGHARCDPRRHLGRARGRCPYGLQPRDRARRSHLRRLPCPRTPQVLRCARWSRRGPDRPRPDSRHLRCRTRGQGEGDCVHRAAPRSPA